MMAALRRYLITGLVVWVPLGVTAFIIKSLIDLMNQSLLLLPDYLQPDRLFGIHIPGVGVVLTVVVVLGTGVITANFFGRKLLALGERLLARIPLVRSIYSAVKQIMETMFSGSGKSFRKVVMLEYPRVGIWTLAFVTGDGAEEIERKSGRRLTHVFVPTTPNPTSGFFLAVPSEDIIELEMTVEEGLKLIISGGAIVPPRRESLLPGSAPAA